MFFKICTKETLVSSMIKSWIPGSRSLPLLFTVAIPLITEEIPKSIITQEIFKDIDYPRNSISHWLPKKFSKTSITQEILKVIDYPRNSHSHWLPKKFSKTSITQEIRKVIDYPRYSQSHGLPKIFSKS